MFPSANQMMLTEWAIPQQSKLKYTQLFNTNDRTRMGFLTGLQARNILIQSQLSNVVLANIWNLSDIDQDGRLTCDEFVLAMHLCDSVRAGDPLPQVLPPELIPPSYRRRKSLPQSQVVGPGVVPGAQPPSVEPVQEEIQGNKFMMATFEDKRRENFEKGQAELDRRRQMLAEQQKREIEERERKEREEHMKREQQRMEQERKRQAEIDKQLQKQKELEAEKEEQRKKHLEQREAARREMERQRMAEWENSRKQDVENQKIKTQEEIQKLKSRKKTLAIETEQTNNKINELQGQVNELRKKVNDVKGDIDSMRTQRDTKMGLLSSLKAQLKGLSDRQLIIEQENINLTNQLKSAYQANLPPGSELNQQQSMQFTIQNKQLNINKLKSQLEEYEKEKIQKANDMESHNEQLKQLKDKLNEMIERTNELASKFEEKKREAQQLKDQLTNIDINAGWSQADEWETPATIPSTGTILQQQPAGKQFKVKYKAMFEFQARNADELTIQPGDIILVDTSACSEPGWITGELRGHIGWFPEAYVERMDVADSSEIYTQEIKHTPLPNITEAPENGNEVKPFSFTVSEESSFQPTASSTPYTKESENVMKPSDTLFQAEAVFHFEAKEDNHLSFVKGDIINVKEQQEDWWFGELNQKSGWFPKSYVKQIGEGGEPIQGGVSQGFESQGGDLEEYCISLYPFDTQEPGDLSFGVNEVIKVIKKDGDWWTGVIGQRQGVFPLNYVRLAQPDEIPKAKPKKSKTQAPQPPVYEMSTPTPPPNGGERKNSESCDSPKPKKTKLKKPEVVIVIAPYKATGSEQLTLEKGQLIQIRKKSESGWWEGESQVKGKKKQVGWFPASYVKALAGTGSGGSSARSTPDSKVKEEPELEKVISIYPFKAQHDDELSFEENEIIKVIAKDDPTWWKGQSMSTGLTGLFPCNHVEPYKEYEEIPEDDGVEPQDNHYHYIDEIGEFEDFNDQENEVENGKFYKTESHETESHETESHETESHGTESQFESHYDEPNYVMENCDKNCDQQSSESIRKRENHIKELISTENSYVKDMEIVYNVFQVPLRQSNCLTDDEAYTIFLNWNHLVHLNRRFYKDLRSRKHSTQSNESTVICDLICDYLTKMLPIYIEFCSKQLSSAKLLQFKTENDPKFNEKAKECAMDPRANRLPLSSYLLKPMQRVTKYPLLIKKILEYTSQDHQDFHHCEKALKLSQTLCDSINEACRQRQDCERFDWIQSHVKLDGIDQIIKFNSITNCLGHRRLLHSGSLIKANSGKELIAFLFNDFLLLTVTRDSKDIGRVTNIFASEKALSCYYKNYRGPLLLSDITVGELSQFESNLDPCLFQIHIHSEEKNLVLKASSSNEKMLWIKSIDSASRHFKDVKRLQVSTVSKATIPVAKLTGIGRLLVTIIEAMQLTTQNNALNCYTKLTLSSDNSDSTFPQSHKTKVIRCVPSSHNGLHLSSGTSSPHQTAKHRHDYLFSVKWKDTTQFIIKDLHHDKLTIECFDRNPFAPHYLIGSISYRISDLQEEMANICGPLKKSCKLIPSNKVHSQQDISPIVYLKLDLQLFNDKK